MLRILRMLKLAKISELDHAHLIGQCKHKGHGHFIPIQGETIEKVVQKHPLVLLVALILPLVLTSLGLITILLSKTNIWGLAVGILLLALAITFLAASRAFFFWLIAFLALRRNLDRFWAILGDRVRL